MPSSEKKFVSFENEEDYNNIDLESIYLLSFTLENIYSAFNSSKLEILKYLVNLRLIKNRMPCNDCGNWMNLVKSKSADGCVWRCNLHTIKIQLSVRSCSFFNDNRKPFKKVFLYYSSKKELQNEINRELTLNKNIISD
jgi:hypothetical protein